MPTEIKLPSLGENIESGDVLSILVSEGETVTAEQDLMEIETDKATMPVPSPEAGTITKVLISEGDTVSEGTVLFEIEASAAGAAAPAPAPVAPTSAPAPTPAPVPKPPAPKPPAVVEDDTAPTPAVRTPTPSAAAAPVAAAPAPTIPSSATSVDTPGDGYSSAAASPSVRRLARELGVDLRSVRPSGSGGRVTEDDLHAHVRAAQEQARSATPASLAPGAASSDGQGAVRLEKMSRMRRTIARNMVASYTTIPQLTNFDDVDVSDLEEMRQQSKGDYAARGMKLTQMPFLLKAIAGALKLHPIVNASVDMEAGQIIYKEYINLGVAVDTDRGLTVPVIRNADQLSISQLTTELARLVTKAREGSLSIDEMRGGTFTISNMGAVGGTYSTPIINPPEVAILLVGRSRMVPTVVDDQVKPRLVMPLSLTYDHRVVDGADAARFVNELKSFLAAPGRLLLAP